MLGTAISHYKVIEKIGQGGMGRAIGLRTPTPAEVGVR